MAVRRWIVLALLAAAPAAAEPLAVLPLADVAGRGSGRQLTRTLLEGLRAQGIEVVPEAEAARAALERGLGWGPSLSDESAVTLDGSQGWAAVLRFRREGRHALRPVAIAADGSRESLPVVPLGRRLSAAALAKLARELRSLVRQRPIAAKAGREPVVPAETSPAAPGEPAGEPTGEAAASHAAAPASPAALEPLPRYRIAAGWFLGTRTLSVPAVFSYTTGTPYGGAVLEGEAFPLEGLLEGLGIAGIFSYGFVQAQLQGQPGSFAANDLGLELALAYRFRPIVAAQGPALELLAGFGLRNFDAPAASGLFDDDRTFPLVGLGIVQPLVPRWLSVEGRLLWLPVATQGAAAQASLGPSQGMGFEWLLGLQGGIAQGFGWAFEVDGQEFTDFHAQIDGSESYRQYRLLLSYGG